MHELSIAEGIIEIVERTAKSNNVNRVKSVRIAVGELAGVDIDCLRFAWQSVTRQDVPTVISCLQKRRLTNWLRHKEIFRQREN